MDGLVLSYAQLTDAAGRTTSMLSSAGIAPGDRVAVMLPNVLAFPIAFYGALGAGAVVVPVNPLLKGREVACYLRDSGATVLLACHTVAGEAGKRAAQTGTRVVEVIEPAPSALLVIAGHNVMKGYWGKPEATAAAITGGWFRTGDFGRVDEDGYFYIVDRKKDMIIRGGFNVYPRAVEEVLYEHPAVAEAAVIGIPHDDVGEEVGATVTLKPGATATPAVLRAFAREQMAPYKYPRYVWLAPGLPKGPTGKILRREVRPPEELT